MCIDEFRWIDVEMIGNGIEHFKREEKTRTKRNQWQFKCTRLHAWSIWCTNDVEKLHNWWNQKSMPWQSWKIGCWKKCDTNVHIRWVIFRWVRPLALIWHGSIDLSCVLHDCLISIYQFLSLVLVVALSFTVCECVLFSACSCFCSCSCHLFLYLCFSVYVQCFLSTVWCFCFCKDSKCLLQIVCLCVCECVCVQCRAVPLSSDIFDEISWKSCHCIEPMSLIAKLSNVTHMHSISVFMLVDMQNKRFNKRKTAHTHTHTHSQSQTIRKKNQLNSTNCESQRINGEISN